MEIVINYKYIYFISFLSFMAFAFLVGYEIGELFGYMNGVIDTSNLYRLDNIENTLNISQNVSNTIGGNK